MEVDQKRHAIRYSLRTLFVVLTLSAVLGWLGWNYQQVREREELLASLRARGALFGFLDKIPRKRVPVVWSWMGATTIGTVDIPAGTFTAEDLERMATLFPEARIREDAGRLDLPIPRPMRQSPRIR